MACGPQPPISGIPQDRLDDFKQMFEGDDPPPLSLTVTADPGGTFTLTAVYPPCPPAPAPQHPAGGTGASGPAAPQQPPAGTGATGPAARAPPAPPGGTGASGPAITQLAAGTGATEPAAPPRPAGSAGVSGHAPPAPARVGSVGNFPPDVIAAAQASQRTWRVPAAVTLAQWALESAWGRSMPVGSNNPFGIKASGDQKYVIASTKEYKGGRYVTEMQPFRVFDSIAEAFDQHGRLLATSHYYVNAMTHIGDPKAFADALTGIYANSPTYGAALKTLMGHYNLTQYDV
jgi:hypothetical protein